MAQSEDTCQHHVFIKWQRWMMMTSSLMRKMSHLFLNPRRSSLRVTEQTSKSGTWTLVQLMALSLLLALASWVMSTTWGLCTHLWQMLGFVCLFQSSLVSMQPCKADRVIRIMCLLLYIALSYLHCTVRTSLNAQIVVSLRSKTLLLMTNQRLRERRSSQISWQPWAYTSKRCGVCCQVMAWFSLQVSSTFLKIWILFPSRADIIAGHSAGGFTALYLAARTSIFRSMVHLSCLGLTPHRSV